MNQENKEKAGLVYNIVESIVLAMSVGLMIWLANVVIAQGQVMASHSTQININTSRLADVEVHGSRAVETLSGRVESISKQMDEMRASILALQSAPGELKAINARLDGLKEGQNRIESLMNEHIKSK